MINNNLNGSGNGGGSSSGSGGGFIASDAAPSDISFLWIDTSHGSVLKYYDVSTSQWITVSSVWG